MKIIKFALIVAPLFVFRLSAQCNSGDIASYWDDSVDATSGYADFWSVVDGGGCTDPCGGGTVGYFVRSYITDQFGNTYADGGEQSETVPMASPGSSRSDVTASANSFPLNAQYTYNAHGYAYQCDCSLCYKLGTFAFAAPISLHQTYYSPLAYEVAHPLGSYTCYYAAVSCGVGTPTCTDQSTAVLFTFTCPYTARARYFVVNGTCTFGLAGDGSADIPRICN
jgi:hypothetical protein